MTKPTRDYTITAAGAVQQRDGTALLEARGLMVRGYRWARRVLR